MNMFATTFAAVVDLASGAVEYVNCGHNPPAVVGPEGIKMRLTPTGPALGMVPGFAYRVNNRATRSGEMLVAFTDGATDARDPQAKFFTEQRLLDIVLESRGDTGRERRDADAGKRRRTHLDRRAVRRHHADGGSPPAPVDDYQHVRMCPGLAEWL